MPHPDPEMCAELTRLSETIASNSRKLDRALRSTQEMERQMKEILQAFPDGVDNHREYHEAIIRAKKAEEAFYTDLKQTVIKRGVLGALVVICGLVWLGVQTWLHLHFSKS